MNFILSEERILTLVENFAMLLGQISYVDCFVFLMLLVPQLLIQIDTLKLTFCIFSAIPFFGKLVCADIPTVQKTSFAVDPAGQDH